MYGEDIKQQIMAKVKLSAVGNSSRKMKDVAQDLVNASTLQHKEIAAGCYLSRPTITKLARGMTNNPQSETIERIFRFFNMRVGLDGVAIKAKYLNQPKKAAK